LDKYTKEMADVVKKGFAGEQLKGALMLVGELYRADVLKLIKSHIPPALAEVTIDNKEGETVPLINTGEYIGSFTTVVTERSKVISD